MIHQAHCHGVAIATAGQQDASFLPPLGIFLQFFIAALY